MENNELFMAIGILGMFIAPVLAYLFPKHYDKWLHAAQAYFERKRAREAKAVAPLPGVSASQYLAHHEAECKACGRLTRNRFQVTRIGDDGWTTSHSSPYCPECCK